jgi:hypothetical protein
MDEYVGDLDVAVDDLVLIEIQQSLKDVPDVRLRPPLRKTAFFPQFGLEIALVAELGDDVTVAVAGEYIETAQHIGVVQFLQDVDLRKQELLQLLALQ